jgi:hypothetical protein
MDWTNQGGKGSREGSRTGRSSEYRSQQARPCQAVPNGARKCRCQDGHDLQNAMDWSMRLITIFERNQVRQLAQETHLELFRTLNLPLLCSLYRMPAPPNMNMSQQLVGCHAHHWTAKTLGKTELGHKSHDQPAWSWGILQAPGLKAKQSCR